MRVDLCRPPAYLIKCHLIAHLHMYEGPFTPDAAGQLWWPLQYSATARQGKNALSHSSAQFTTAFFQWSTIQGNPSPFTAWPEIKL